VRKPCMLIYGVSGAGKSMLLEKFQRDHAKTDERRGGRRMIIAAELPPVPLLSGLYAEIIRSMNADVSPTTRLHELECTAVNMLAHASPRMVLIDEIHNLLSCSARDQRAALNAIKYLANKSRVSIVAAGTYEALHVMRSDSQIASRFEQLELPIWTESQALRRFIAGYLALLPFKKATAEIDKRFVVWSRRSTARMPCASRSGLRSRRIDAWTIPEMPPQNYLPEDVRLAVANYILNELIH
jgi:Bacterial TniB protein